MSAFKDQVTVQVLQFEADDIREFYDAHSFRVWHLRGKDRIYRIARITPAVITFRGQAKRRPLLWLETTKGEPIELPFECAPTNRNTIMAIYTKKPKAWIGKYIQLYPTTTEVAGEMKECIRVRPWDPEKRKREREAGQAYTNRQGAHVLPSKPAELPSGAGADAFAFDFSKLDEADKRAGNVTSADYIDTTADNDEPPPGALETDPPPSSAGAIIT